MTYQAYALADISEVPDKIRDFITNYHTSWTVTSSGTVTATPPGSPTRSFDITANNGGVVSGDSGDSWVKIAYNGGSPWNGDAWLFPPIYATGSGSGDGAFRDASQLFLFGQDDGDATGISGVIEFGFGRYRHFHMGRIRKHGTWDDGSILAVSNMWNYRSYTGYSPPKWDEYRHRYMFKSLVYTGHGVSEDKGQGHRGGIAISHPDDPQTFREFYLVRPGAYYDPDDYGDGTEVFGGGDDGPLGALVVAGFAPLSSSNLLITIELFSNCDDGGGGKFYRALGSPVGVRHVNFTNLAPAQEITVGTDVWVVFPAARHDPTRPDEDYNGYYPVEENSGPIGYAYRK